MIQQLIFLKELQDMQAFSLLLKIWRLICRFISIEGFIEMEPEYIKQVLLTLSTRDRMAFLIIIEELLDGTQCLSKTILLVELFFLLTLSDIRAIQVHQSGQIEIKI